LNNSKYIIKKNLLRKYNPVRYIWC